MKQLLLYLTALWILSSCSSIAHRVAYGPKKSAKPPMAASTSTSSHKSAVTQSTTLMPGPDPTEYKRLAAEVEALKAGQQQILAENKRLQKQIEDQNKVRHRSSTDVLYGEDDYRKRPAQPVSTLPASEGTRYYYIAVDSLDVYEGKYSRTRLARISPGDTISSDSQLEAVDGRQLVEWRGYMVGIHNPSVQSAGTRRSTKRTIMYPMYSLRAMQESGDNQPSTMHSTPTTGASIYTGPRGGQYYYNSKGNKTYIKRK